MSNSIYLNIASSTHCFDNYINLDKSIYIKFAKFYLFSKLFLSQSHLDTVNKYREAYKKGILFEHDCRKKLKFKDNSVHHILCSHFLEHVYPYEADVILTDFYRVLKKGGTAHLILPDLQILVDNYIKNNNPSSADKFIKSTILTKEKRPSLRFRILEMLGRYGLQHYWMYDKKSMMEKVTKIGFVITSEKDIPSLLFRKNDDISFHIFVSKK